MILKGFGAGTASGVALESRRQFRVRPSDTPNPFRKLDAPFRVASSCPPTEEAPAPSCSLAHEILPNRARFLKKTPALSLATLLANTPSRTDKGTPAAMRVRKARSLSSLRSSGYRSEE